MNDERLQSLQARAKLATEVAALLTLLRENDIAKSEYAVTISYKPTGSFPLSSVSRELAVIGRSEKMRMLEAQLEDILGGGDRPGLGELDSPDDGPSVEGDGAKPTPPGFITSGHNLPDPIPPP